ncbi:MAG: hypothetical protein EPN97_17190 [Alphaproteobacteria bacterium]|nr:MAG: hypothetical protein EPN97_17190 [Alphaproteobacteria bacterium]
MITADQFFAAKRDRQKTKDTHHHCVYVIELDKKVLKDRRFRAANPNHDPAKPCFYVGSTGMSPEMRFINHKRGYKGNRYVQKYGIRLRPDLYEVYNPMPWQAAIELEAELAAGLREERYAVWQA